MKNKIIALSLLLFMLIPMFNFSKAAVFLDTRVTTEKKGSELEMSDIDISSIEDLPYRMCTKTVSGSTINYSFYAFNKIPTHNCITGKEVSGTDYGTDYCMWVSEDEELYVKNLNVITSSNWNSYNVIGQDYNFAHVRFNFSTLLYNNFDLVRNGEVLVESCEKPQDDSISDPSSNLQLSYEYNEDYTSCTINATLNNGSFTDKIYYSNYAPSISGQGLITKKGFPAERFNCY